MELNIVKEKILREVEGCRFFKIDFHVHTPASRVDYSDKSTTPEMIIEAAISKGLDAIAITDHNSVEWCEKILDAAKGKIYVFPGIELTVAWGQEGAHLLILFDSTKPIQQIRDCLAKIDMDSKKQGDTTSISTTSLPEIFAVVKEHGGIVIGAHADCDKGIVDARGEQRIAIVQNTNLSALEIRNPDNVRYYDGLDPNYKRKIACVRGSDAHNIEDIGKSFSLIKMEKPSIEGLRQAFCDPDSRVIFEPGLLQKHPRLIGVYIEGGFLDGQSYRFNDNMNALIGGKGTGKTTTIELIRYGLSSKQKDEKACEEAENLVRGVLGGGTVYILVRSIDEQQYMIRRTGRNEPEIFKDDGTPLQLDIKSFRQFFDIEGYSQGELIQIAKDSSDQLLMLDRHVNFENLFEEEKVTTQKLSENATTIIQVDRIILDCKLEIDKLPSINEKIRIVEEKGLKAHSEEQKKWEYERDTLTAVSNRLQERLNAERTAIVELEDVPYDEHRSANPDDVKAVLSDYKSLGTQMQTRQAEKIALLEKCRVSVQEKYHIWEQKYNVQKTKLLQLTQELKSKGIDVEHYIELENEKARLERKATELIGREDEKQKLLKKRESLINELNTNREAISSKRKVEIDSINEKLKDMLRIDLRREANISSYTQWMMDCLKGSRIQHEYSKQLCEKIKPGQFYDIIINKPQDRVDILFSQTGLGKSQIERILEFLPKEKLFELQTLKLEDSLDIKFNDSGWKSISELSTGGKCTALLLIAMLERSIPLLIDQPEDSLDNSFIYVSIVQIIRKLKDKRQLIIATHNANIPILGDCEHMFVLKSNGINGYIDKRGGIDNGGVKDAAQTILEGGAEAFRKTARKVWYMITAHINYT